MNKSVEGSHLSDKNVDKKMVIKFAKILLAGLGAVLIFVIGINVGNGRIQFGAKSVTKDLPADLDYTSVEQLYDALKRTYDGQLDAQKLMDGLKDGLAKATGDQYTEYLSSKEAKEFNDDLNGTFSGIGAELGKEENFLIVVSPIAGFPAEKAGLRPKDIITAIDNEPAYDLSVSEAVSKIRGPEGTKVKLKIVRSNSEELEFEIVRSKITIPSVTSEIIEGNIGYIKVSRFSDDTAGLSREAAEKFKRAGVAGVILDMRGNPGGLLDSAVDISGLWLPKGKTVLQEKRGGKVIRSFTAKGSAVLQGVPTVVLIDEGSASASEITAGALKDNDAATLIGQKTFGKGSVQQLESLSAGSILKVTIARWYTPGGKNIDKEGIEPDQKVERTADDFAAGRDPQKEAAINFLKK